MVQMVTRKNIPNDIKKRQLNANCFYSKEFEAFLESQGWRLIFFYDENYIMPCGLKRNHFIFKTGRFESEPFAYTDNTKKLDADGEKRFLEDVNETIKRNKILDFTYMTPTYGLFKSFPDDSIRIKFGNYVLSIEDDILSKFSSKHRNMVRRGMKANLDFKIGGEELLDDYIVLDKETWKRSNVRAENGDLYKKFIENFNKKSLLSIAYKDGKPQCGILGCFNDSMFYYMYGATANHAEPGSTHFLQYETMEYLKSLGVKKYNFVGCRIDEDIDSKYHKIQHFKKGFGGELVQGYMFKTIFNDKKYKLYRYLLKLKHKDYKGDVIDQEVHKWLSIN